MNDRASFNDPHADSLFPQKSFNRRDFIVSGTATGFALSAGPLMAQQVRLSAGVFCGAEKPRQVSGGAGDP